MTEHRTPRNQYRLAMVMGAAIAVVSISGCVQPPELPQPTKGLDVSPSVSPGTTVGYLKSLEFNENPGLQLVDVYLPCHPPHACGGQNAVHLRIVAEGQSHLVNWQAALHTGSGHVLSRITNMDPVRFGPWNMAPYDTAYLWIGPIPGHPRDLALFHREGTAFSFIAFAVSKGYCAGGPATGPAVHVNHPPQCHGHFARTFDNSNRLASNSTIDLTRALGHDQGLWQGCPQGCCETALM